MREVAWNEGDVVRKLRVAAGWRIRDLSEATGLSINTINEIELGKTKEAKRTTLAKIAGAFGLTFPQFLAMVPQSSVRLEVNEENEIAVRRQVDQMKREERRILTRRRQPPKVVGRLTKKR